MKFNASWKTNENKRSVMNVLCYLLIWVIMHTEWSVVNLNATVSCVINKNEKKKEIFFFCRATSYCHKSTGAEVVTADLSGGRKAQRGVEKMNTAFQVRFQPNNRMLNLKGSRSVCLLRFLPELRIYRGFFLLAAFTVWDLCLPEKRSCPRYVAPRLQLASPVST